MAELLKSLRRRAAEDRRGIALIMVMLVVSSLLIIGLLFAGSVTAEYRAAVYYRQAIQSEQYCVVGLHRAMAELSYDIWGVNEEVPFRSARYSNVPNPGPDESLQPLGEAAYYDMESGSLKPLDRQRGYWNGEAWVVWAGEKIPAPAGFDASQCWQNFDPRPHLRSEMVGGAQRYRSYGYSLGTVTCTNGSTTVTCSQSSFSTLWGNTGSPDYPYDIYISGSRYQIQSVSSGTQLTLKQDYGGASAAGLGWYVPYQSTVPPSGDSSLSYPSGPQSLADFVAAGKGYAADPRWVDPAKFLFYRYNGIWQYGGADLNADGVVNADDKSLRNWALWQLRRDSFLPESSDNYDLFQPAMHANNRGLWLNGPSDGSYDYGYEFIDPKLVGDSFYLVFRSDPLYSLSRDVSGEGTSPGDPLDGSSKPGEVFDGKPDQAGYRYPYDRTHLNKWSSTPISRDVCGGLANINGCNNDYNIEQLTDVPGANERPGGLTWYHYPEAKWIYCFDAVNPDLRMGRYAVTVMPDCGVWNSTALHSGKVNPCAIRREVPGHGCVQSAQYYLQGVRWGFNPQNGDCPKAALLQANAYCPAPVHPQPLPAYWMNIWEATGAWCDETNPDRQGSSDYRRPYSRAIEVWSHNGAAAPPYLFGDDASEQSHNPTTHTSFYNYMIWLGPYDSRAEFSTHMRKACLVYFSSGYEHRYVGDDPNRRRRMEERRLEQSAQDLIASDARMISALTTVQGYYYALDRFWDRSLVLINSGVGGAGSTDSRFSTPQTDRGVGTTFATAALLPGQRTRSEFLRTLNSLECYGGYRTRDGGYKLMDYLFTGDKWAYDPDTAPASSPSAVYGGGGDRHDPSSWAIQRQSGRREKFMAMCASRMACQQSGPNAVVAACSRGHLLHYPRIHSMMQPKTGTGSPAVRTDAMQGTLDEIGQGCPVCGGKLFVSRIHEMNINEIGRMRERLRTAERPSRPAGNMHSGLAQEGERPWRHFVELYSWAHSSECGGPVTDGVAQVDYLISAGGYWAQRPGVLVDDITGMPYFTHSYGFDMRYRRSPGEYDGEWSMDCEPVFRALPRSREGLASYGGPLNLHLLVYDETENGGRWHDVTHYAQMGGFPDSGGSGYFFADQPLYNGRWRYCADDTKDSSWTWAHIRADENYVMPDPDPAHQQDAAGRFNAGVKLYRKMPVRFYGGNRRCRFDTQYDSTSGYRPQSRWAPHMPPGWCVNQQTYSRGLSWAERQMYRDSAESGSPLLNLTTTTYQGQCWSADKRYYKGDYRDEGTKGVRDPGDNLDGWPGPIKRDCMPGVHTSQTIAARGTNPRQYGIISFDASFDGSRVALLHCGDAKQRPNYTSWDSTYKYKGYYLIDYVELTDSTGRPVRISDSCKVDPDSGNRTMLSWQCRNALDNRSNADGYTCWDLLPMTLHGWPTGLPTPYKGLSRRIASDTANEAAGNPCDAAGGYSPWPEWWACAPDSWHAAIDKVTNANPTPPGYADLWAADTNCRNRNNFTRDIPVRRLNFRGARWGSENSTEALFELMRIDNNDLNALRWEREPLRKDCTYTVPTGIGRQCSQAMANDRANREGTYSGMQHVVLPGYTWQEGSGSNNAIYQWAGYSWNDWRDIYNVTDLCQQYMLSRANTREETDCFDADQDGVTDEQTTASLDYSWSGGVQPVVRGHYTGERRLINKVNLNEVWYPPMYNAVGWTTSFDTKESPISFASFGRKPLKGFHSPSDAMTFHFNSAGTSYYDRVKPFDLDMDDSVDRNWDPTKHDKRLDSVHTGTSPVHTIFVTGNAVNPFGEPLAEMRARVTVERTWDGRMNILEFTWMPTDRGFME